jgi:hypothetical protein
VTETEELHAEIGDLMEQVMEGMGGGTMMIPDEIQRGMNEMGNPSLDADGLRRLRDDLRRVRDEQQSAAG